MSFRNFLSYLFPSTVESAKWVLTDDLRVVHMNGKYQLSAPNANYSYGGCSSVFLNVFRTIEFERYTFQSVLILGLGAGGVVSLMGETYGKYPHITGVEGDSTVVELAKKYFAIERFDHLDIVQADAFEYATTCQKKYDLVIVDLFVNDEVPPQFHTPEFIRALQSIAADESMVIFNKMTHRNDLKDEVIVLGHEFEKAFEHVDIVRTVVNGKENSVVVCNSFPPNPVNA